MSRLSLAGVLGLVAAGLVGLGVGRAQEGRPAAQPKHAEHAKHFMDCAKACDDCARICDACGAHCMRMVADGKKEHLETPRTCQDCATVCSAAARITARMGPYSDAICQACADVCKRCGDACEKHAADPMMKQCADECRKCEKACRDMLAHARPAGARWVDADVTQWFLIAGGLLVAMALAGTLVERLPLSAAMFYLAVGYGIGPGGLGLLAPDPIRDATVLELLAEVAVLVSLFSAGLKLRAPWTNRRWLLPIRLAGVSMLVTVGVVAALGVYGLGLPLGAAVLLGAVLAPTDPVLASDVQVSDAWDRDKLRFALTGEAGLNDGTAFPFVMLGLGLLGLHHLGGGLHWVGVDLVWAIAAGLAVGALLGSLLGRLVVYLRKHHREALGLDEFLALGLIALAYGAALAVGAYGFLAVFAAGAALRRVEMRTSGDRSPDEVRDMTAEGKAAELATDPEKAPAFLAEEALRVVGHVERILEVALVVVLGSLVTRAVFVPEVVWFVPLVFLVIRPVSVLVGLAGTSMTGVQRGLIGWFGVRGIGSIYYLMFAVTHGLPVELSDRLVPLTLSAVTASVVLHGVSVTPLMNAYARVSGRGARRQAGA